MDRAARMIVGTAGHIDHGKTSLVRALTGVDTDRLKEEKARGISIELGYAYVPVDGAAGEAEPVLGFVDVPGHERLVHTMVAGAGGIDFALLVIAADDGVMPQTREHLAILDLLGVARGAVALSKADRVDAARLREVQAQVAALLEPTALRGAPVFPLDAMTAGDPGVAALRAFLHNAAAAAARRDESGVFHLAVDRVFTLAGQGTVATGTVRAGRVHVGDSVTVMPAGVSVRVRGIHAQNRAADAGRAGQRCALNLAGIEREAIARGDWLADARLFRPSLRWDANLRLLPGAATLLRNWTPLHVHCGTAHQVAHAVLLDAERLGADESGRVQLVFDAPMCAVVGDRFIVRDAQAARTVGGGTILDADPPERRRRSPVRMAWLTSVERLLAGEGVAALLEQSPYGIALEDLVRLCTTEPERIALPDSAYRIETVQGSFVFLAAHWHALRERVLAALREFHARQPDEAGADGGRLRRLAVPALAEAAWQRLLADLLSDAAIRREGPWLHLPEHRVEPSEEERRLLQRLHPLIDAGGYDPPWVRDLAQAAGTGEDVVRRTLRRSAASGFTHQVVRDLFYTNARVAELAAVLGGLAHRHGAVEAAQYRDALGIGRKRAIQILEFFDRVGYTRRARDAHVLRGEGGWFDRR
jgi:selenocysteine-specific elongation factor